MPLDEHALLIELEPEAGRLYDRHARVAQEWFPHDYIPYRLGRDFDKEPWTPDQPRLTGVAQTAFEVGLLTEDNLPSYHRLIHGMFAQGDGAWINWIGRWTAEEGRHAIVIRDYLTVTRNLDPTLLERGRMAQLQKGYDHDSPDTLHGLAYVAFQELATRISRALVLADELNQLIAVVAPPIHGDASPSGDPTDLAPPPVLTPLASSSVYANHKPKPHKSSLWALQQRGRANSTKVQ